MSESEVLLSEGELEKFGKFAPFVDGGGSMELGRGTPRAEVKAKLNLLESELGHASDAERCCLAAAWLFQNYLDESHEVSQQIDTPAGSYLHGIMHRREGDYSNAKYWFRRAGDPGFFSPLEKQIQNDPLILPTVKSALDGFDPFQLTDLVSQGDKKQEKSLQRVSWWECLAALDFCHSQTP